MSISVEKLRKIHPAIWLAVATVASLALFLNKPFNIDDPLFIWTAKHIQSHPMSDFYGFPVNWYGVQVDMSVVQQNPPLLAYYLALIGNFFGWSELALHAGMLLPALLLVLGTWKLAGEFVSRSWLPALVALFSPAVMVSSMTVMCDVLMVGFWIWAVYFWMRGLKQNDGAKLFIAGLLIALAALTKYFGVALIPLLLVYGLIKTRRLGWWLCYFLVPLAILAGYQWVTARIYGHDLLTHAATYANHARIHEVYAQLLTGLCFTGGASAVVVFYAPLWWSWRRGWWMPVLAVAICVPLFFLQPLGIPPIVIYGSPTFGLIVQLALFALAGIHLLAVTAIHFRSRRDADTLLLLLWIFGTLIFAVFVNWTVNVRSLLPVTPAIAILLVALLEQRKIALKKMLWPLIPGALIALGVAWADYDYAVTCRKAARTLFADYGGAKLWFQGHWGFQYYMEQLGARQIDLNNSRMAQGDLVITPEHNTNLQNLEADARGTNMVEFLSHAIMAVSSPKTGAGFYSTSEGPAPFTIGPSQPERYMASIALHDVIFAKTDCLNHILQGNKARESGDHKGAMEEYRFALQFPGDLPPRGLIMIAWILATEPDQSLRDGPLAVQLAVRANRLTHLQDPRVLDVLGAAYAENGQMPEAIRSARAAVEAADAQGLAELAKMFRHHLELFQAGQAVRD